MKKFIVFLLAVTLLAGLFGCGREKVYWDPTYQIPTAPKPTTSVQVKPQQLPMISVSLPVVTQDYLADDGTTIYKHTNQNISLIVPEPEVAEKVILDFLNRTDMQSTIESVHSFASSAYTDGVMSQSLPYWTQITYAPTRIDSGILSLNGSYVQYSGGAHPAESVKTVTYDLVTGEVLSLENILTEDLNRNTLCQLVLNALSDYEKELSISLYSDYESTVKALFEKPLSEIANWCFTEDGLSFYFSPYEISAYAYGIIPAVVSYEDLAGILLDAYFPAERDAAPGTIEAEAFSEENLNNYTQLAEIVIDKDQDAILLNSEGMLYDIKIITGTWNEDKTTFTTEHTIFRAFSLTPGDAIMVQCDLNNICIQYTASNKTETVFPIEVNNPVTLK